MTKLYNYSLNIRKLIYTTHVIVLYLRVKEISKKWNRSTKSNWTIILNELIDLFGHRVEKYINI